ncbi:hypothetical protein BJ138DRAFT_1168334 [Hygrophoropsis aurantiaca]|uniref:Uncharacterized protein n=1 Tax=Hygrophoropsis aurantiaca TaxID=72124 RepID=A0ACB7ZQE8_9AGAM|nr:hypothetical protein BJ138DRAFT_1168334 [Hygrophoropsis aurantiaca]
MDFEIQEPDSPNLGRHARQPRLTPGMIEHNAQLARLAASRNARQQNHPHHHADTSGQSIHGMEGANHIPRMPPVSQDNSNSSFEVDGAYRTPYGSYTAQGNGGAHHNPDTAGPHYSGSVVDTAYSQVQYYAPSGPGSNGRVVDHASDSLNAGYRYPAHFGTHPPADSDDTNQKRIQQSADPSEFSSPPPANMPNEQMSSTPLPLPRRKLMRQNLTRQDTPYPFGALGNSTSTDNLPRSPTPASVGARTTSTKSSESTDFENKLPINRTFGAEKRVNGDEDEDTSSAPHQKATKKLRPTAGELSPLRRRVSEAAWVRFRARIATLNPFPDDTKADRWAIESWFEAIEDLREDLDLGDDGEIPEELLLDAEDIIVPLICQRESQLRGQVVSKAKELLPSMYGFKPGKTAEAINHNRALYQKLLLKNAYLYENPLDRDALGTLYKHPIFAEIVNLQWFSASSKSEGIVMSKYFNAPATPDSEDSEGIPLATIALIATAIRNALGEWATGDRKRISFDAKVYAEKYVAHLKYITNWKTYTSTRRRTTHILQKSLWEGGCAFAGVIDVEMEPAQLPELDESDFAKDEGC